MSSTVHVCVLHMISPVSKDIEQLFSASSSADVLNKFGYIFKDELNILYGIGKGNS